MADRANSNRFSRQGFTLIELAIVLVIVGLLVGIGSSMVGVLTSAIKVRESREILDAATQSITSWASSNNRIPPFSTVSPDIPSNKFDQVVKNPNDAWGRALVYYFDSNLAPTGATAPTKDTICGRRSTFITLKDSDNATINIPNVAFVVISTGDNVNQDTTISPAPASPGAVTGTTVVIADTYNDIVRWVTLDELRSKAGCLGAPLKILNNEFPFAPVTTYPDTTVAVDGGVPPYSWCIQTAVDATPPAGLTFHQDTTTGTAMTAVFASCNSNLGSWNSAAQLVLNGAPSGTGSYYFSIFVKDSDNTPNIVSKPFVLTINPN